MPKRFYSSLRHLDEEMYEFIGVYTQLSHCAYYQMPTWRRFISFNSTKMIIKELSLSHHVGNVFIYLATSRRFRKLTAKSLSKPKRRRCERRDTSLQTIRSVNTRSMGDAI
ncbi:hypothetical protein ElyMa_000684400 [Elysia marginata]|uniref:Uncharacterized protein n=1 Tax=Elysia marginata TaxID=1093978 RepID=A0AAV4GHH5_9GAST|nr:hypothetical protein ElyMa_000684400 [Elysia marginata]